MLALLLCVPLVSALSIAETPSVSEEVQNERKMELINRLTLEFPEPQDNIHIAKIVSDTRFAIDETIFASGGSGKGAFAYLFTPSSINTGRSILAREATALNQAAKQFAVPKEVIVSIIMIETEGNPHAGKWPVVVALLTQAILNPDEEHRAKATRWLVAFLKLCDEYKWGPFDQKGSTWGAFGLWQAEPPTYQALSLRYHDGICQKPEGFAFSDPSNFGDASCSIALFLRNAYWNETRERQKKVIFQYNHSNKYVAAVLKYANIMRHPDKKKSQKKSKSTRAARKQRSVFYLEKYSAPVDPPGLAPGSTLIKGAVLLHKLQTQNSRAKAA